MSARLPVRSGPPRPVVRSLALIVLSFAAACPAATAAAQDIPTVPLPGGETGTLTLDEITVTANRTPTPQREVGSAVTVITAEELEQQQIRIVSDVLREVPGVAVSRGGGAGQLTQIRIRGSEGNQTMVLIDGIEVNDPAAGDEFDFGRLMAQDIERIEVLRGPQSALYGSDAVGGVVNIVTRRGSGPASVSARLEGGSFTTGEGQVTVSGGNERADILLSALAYASEGTSTAAEWHGNRERDGYVNGTVLGKGGFSVTEDLRFDFVGRFTRTGTDLDTKTKPNGALIDSDDDVLGQQTFGRAQATLDRFDGAWQQILGATWTDQNRNYRTKGLSTSTYQGTTAKVDYQSNVFLETPEILDARHTLTFAADYKEDGVVSSSAWSDLDRSVGSAGLVGQYQLGLMDSLYLTGAVRYDANEMFEDTTTGRLTAAYTLPATGTKVRGSWGTGVKNPTLFELYGYTQTYHGNRRLKPEQATGWDVGIDQPVWDDRVILDVTYFRQRISDLITGAGNTSVNLAGESKIDGVEAGIGIAPADGLFIRAAYTYTDGTDATGAELVRRPRDTASLTVNYAFLDDRANVNLSVVYNGAQTDWAWNKRYAQRTVDLDAYTLLNVAASYQMTEQAQLYGRVENLLDERYEEVWSYGGSGIAAYAGVKIRF